MKKTIIITCTILFLILCGIFSFAEMLYYPPSINQLGSITLPKTNERAGYTVSMTEDTEGPCRWEGDCLLLTLKQEGPAKSLIKKIIESSYGSFRLYLADLTGDGVEEILLITGEGRGTSARKEKLTVYCRVGDSFKEITTIPISDYFGSGKRWWYELRFEKDYQISAVIFSLLLRHDSWRKDESLVSPDLIPKETAIAYRWNATKKVLERIEEE